MTAIIALGASASVAVEPERVETRTGMVSAITAGWEYLDKDRDRLVSRAEWDAMAETHIALLESDAQDHGDPRQIRRDIRYLFDVDDADRDGYLTLAEMLALPLATFDCMDRNGDQAMTLSESFASLEACEHLVVKMPEIVSD